jgi:hypothetical protein
MPINTVVAPVYGLGRAERILVGRAKDSDPDLWLGPLWITQHAAQSGQDVILLPWRVVHGVDTSGALATRGAAPARAYLDDNGSFTFVPVNARVPIGWSLWHSATDGVLLLWPGKSINTAMPRMIKKRIQHTDLTAASTSQTVVFDDVVPSHAAIIGMWMKVDTFFTGGSVSACVVDFGDDRDSDGWYQNQSVFTVVASDAYRRVPSTPGPELVNRGGDIWTVVRTPQVEFTATGDTVNNITAGDATFYVMYVEDPIGAPEP